MSRIIAARFDTFDAATGAADQLFSNGVIDKDVHVFYVNPGGRHDTYPIGGDRAVDPDSSGGGGGAIKGVVIGACLLGVVGLLLVLILSWHWGVVVLFALAGAYIGSLQGAVSGLGWRRTRRSVGAPAPNVMLAIRIDGYDRASMVSILERAGGTRVEDASGQWEDGKWADFDPLAEPHEIDAPDVPGRA